MKHLTINSFSIALVLLLACPEVFSQRIEIIPSAGYQTSARINSVGGDFRLNDGLNYGISLEVGLPLKRYKIYASYSHQNSLLRLETPDIERDVCDIAVHNITLGGMAEFFQGDMVVPFSKFGLGSTIYHPLDSDIVDERIMHINLAGGAKVYLGDHFGFRFQASLFLPFFFEGYYFEEGEPQTWDDIKTRLTGVHADFSAGVVVRF